MGISACATLLCPLLSAMYYSGGPVVMIGHECQMGPLFTSNTLRCPSAPWSGAFCTCWADCDGSKRLKVMLSKVVLTALELRKQPHGCTSFFTHVTPGMLPKSLQKGRCADTKSVKKGLKEHILPKLILHHLGCSAIWVHKQSSSAPKSVFIIDHGFNANAPHHMHCMCNELPKRGIFLPLLTVLETYHVQLRGLNHWLVCCSNIVEVPSALMDINHQKFWRNQATMAELCFFPVSHVLATCRLLLGCLLLLLVLESLQSPQTLIRTEYRDQACEHKDIAHQKLCALQTATSTRCQCPDSALVYCHHGLKTAKSLVSASHRVYKQLWKNLSLAVLDPRRSLITTLADGQCTMP